MCVCAAGLCVRLRRFVYNEYMWPKNGLFEVLPLENRLLVQYTARSSSLTANKGDYFTRQFVQGKKFGGILLMGWEKGF